jgi:hypothetical protein
MGALLAPAGAPEAVVRAGRVRWSAPIRGWVPTPSMTQVSMPWATTRASVARSSVGARSGAPEGVVGGWCPRPVRCAAEPGARRASRGSREVGTGPYAAATAGWAVRRSGCAGVRGRRPVGSIGGPVVRVGWRPVWTGSAAGPVGRGVLRVRCQPWPRVTPEARGGPPVRGTREGVRRPRGGARDEFPDSNRPQPPADGPDGKLPPAEGTSRSCYRRAPTSPHSLTPQPFTPC